MDLPVMPPVRPMLAKSVKGIPDPATFFVDGIDGLSFEPKWDGFRCLVFKDGDEVELASRNTKPLTRYFPEVVTAMREQLPARCVLDGEIFVALRGDDGVDRLEFETLQERIHPAKSRIDMLAEKTPAGFVAFDLLALGDRSYVERPFAERRAALETRLVGLDGPCFLTRTTSDPAKAEEWFHHFEGAGLDGVVAKPLGTPYAENARTMLKIKHERTADVVVAGLPRTQDQHARAATARQPPARSVRRRRAAAHRRQRQLHRGPPRRADRAAPAARGADRGASVGSLGGVPDRESRPRARHPEPVEPGQGPQLHPAAPRPGDRGRRTTTWRAGASATPHSSDGGAPTATPRAAATTSSTNPSPTT